MEYEVVSVNELKKGETIIIDGRACRITDITTSAPGKHGHAKARIEAIGILDGKKRSIVLPTEDKVQVPKIVKRSGQVISVNPQDKTAQIMDLDTYEAVTAQIPDELLDRIKEGTEVNYAEVEGVYLIRSLK